VVGEGEAVGDAAAGALVAGFVVVGFDDGGGGFGLFVADGAERCVREAGHGVA